MTVAGRRPPSRWSWSSALGASRIVSIVSIRPSWVAADRTRRRSASPCVRVRSTEGGRDRRACGGELVATGWTGADGDIEWVLELDRADLIPGRLVAGLVRMTALEDVRGRAVMVTLRGEERWKYVRPRRQGEPRRRGSRGPAGGPGSGCQARIELARGQSLPAGVRAPGTGARAAHDRRRQGIGTVDARGEARHAMGSTRPSRRRSGSLQPTALLRAGVVHVGHVRAVRECRRGRPGRRERCSVALDPDAPRRGCVVYRPESASRRRGR